MNEAAEYHEDKSFSNERKLTLESPKFALEEKKIKKMQKFLL